MNNVKLNLLAHYHAAGLEHYNRREYAQALKSFDRVLAMEPAFAEAHYGRALVYSVLNRLNLAFYDLERALQLAPRLKEMVNKDDRLRALKQSFWWRGKVGKLLRAA